MSMASKQERRAETTMRMVTGLGGLMAVSLLMAAMPSASIAQPQLATNAQAGHGQ